MGAFLMACRSKSRQLQHCLPGTPWMLLVLQAIMIAVGYFGIREAPSCLASAYVSLSLSLSARRSTFNCWGLSSRTLCWHDMTSTDSAVEAGHLTRVRIAALNTRETAIPFFHAPRPHQLQIDLNTRPTGVSGPQENPASHVEDEPVPRD